MNEQKKNSEIEDSITQATGQQTANSFDVRLYNGLIIKLLISITIAIASFFAVGLPLDGFTRMRGSQIEFFAFIAGSIAFCVSFYIVNMNGWADKISDFANKFLTRQTLGLTSEAFLHNAKATSYVLCCILLFFFLLPTAFGFIDNSEMSFYALPVLFFSFIGMFVLFEKDMDILLTWFPYASFTLLVSLHFTLINDNDFVNTMIFATPGIAVLAYAQRSLWEVLNSKIQSPTNKAAIILIGLPALLAFYIYFLPLLLPLTVLLSKKRSILIIPALSFILIDSYDRSRFSLELVDIVGSLMVLTLILFAPMLYAYAKKRFG